MTQFEYYSLKKLTSVSFTSSCVVIRSVQAQREP